MKIGCARVSRGDQNLELQLDALENTGCEEIFTDKMSGARSDRPGLNEAIKFICKLATKVPLYSQSELI